MTDTYEKKLLICSESGDIRFTDSYAKLTLRGEEHSIQEFYQNALRRKDGTRAEELHEADHLIDPFSGRKMPLQDAPWLYRGLWLAYLEEHPDLVEIASQYDDYSDPAFDLAQTAKRAAIAAYDADPFDKKLERQAKFPRNPGIGDILGAYIANPERYTAVVRAYGKFTKLPDLKDMIESAESRSTDKPNPDPGKTLFARN